MENRKMVLNLRQRINTSYYSKVVASVVFAEVAVALWVGLEARLGLDVGAEVRVKMGTE